MRKNGMMAMLLLLSMACMGSTVAAEKSASRVILGGVLPERTAAGVAFYPFDQYAPADNKLNHFQGVAGDARSYVGEGGQVRDRLETTVAKACEVPVNAIREAIRAGLKQAIIGAGEQVEFAGVTVEGNSEQFLRLVKAMPYLERRRANLAIYFESSAIKTVYEGKLTNPEPKKPKAEKGLFEQLSGIKKSFQTIGSSTEERIKNTQPLTFEGAAKFTYSAKYRVFDVATGQELRAGAIGPVTVVSTPWQASWQLPGNSSHALDPDFGIYQQYIHDPRDKVLPETLAALATKVRDAVGESFADWSEMLAASKELRASAR